MKSGKVQDARPEPVAKTDVKATAKNAAAPVNSFAPKEGAAQRRARRRLRRLSSGEANSLRRRPPAVTPDPVAKGPDPAPTPEPTAATRAQAGAAPDAELPPRRICRPSLPPRSQQRSRRSGGGARRGGRPKPATEKDAREARAQALWDASLKLEKEGKFSEAQDKLARAPQSVPLHPDLLR
jgi:hypothetical protein